MNRAGAAVRQVNWLLGITGATGVIDPTVAPASKELSLKLTS